jgi:outer membrane lipoprotein-sorting protein
MIKPAIRTLALVLAVLVPITALGITALTAHAAAPSAAAPSDVPAPSPGFDDDARKDIKRIESYLDSLRTLHARFVQITPEGGYAEGEVYLSRPGKARFEYSPPEEILLVADGQGLIFYDKGLEQVSYLPLSASPAGFFLDDRIVLDGEKVTVTALRRSPGLIQITLVNRTEPDIGRLTITFGDRPLVLRNWTVDDAQGQTVTVALLDLETGLTLDPKLFEFNNPLFRKRFPTY